MRFRLLLLAIAMLLIAPLSRAENCNSTIIDQAGVIHNPQIIGSAASTLINHGADVKVVIVDSIQRYGSNLSDVERYFESTCPSWTTNGQRKANLFVVMVAPNDRQKNMFLGSYYAGAFDITSTYSQLSNSYFKNRQWELGLAAALQGTTGQASSFRSAQLQQSRPQTYTAPTYTQVPTQTTQTQDSGMSGLAIFFIVLLTLGLIGGIVYLVYRKKTEESEATTNYGTETVDTTPVYPSSSYPRTYAATASASPSSSIPPAPVQHTTIINNNPGNSGDGLLTGLVVGEMLSRPNPTVVYEPAPTYVEPTPTYVPEPTPAPTQDAPDSTWSAPAQEPDTSFTPEPESAPSYDPPSSDFGSSGGDSSFGGGSDFGGGSSGGDSGF